MDLVFKESEQLTEVPFTTSKVIAEYGEISHHAVQQLIKRYESDLTEFGISAFEMRKLTPGRGRKSKIYHLNREQATLLITYLDNTEPVRRFKKELVKQFFLMESDLQVRRLERQQGKEIRLSMTDAIKNMNLPPHYYKIYTDLAYKSALGFTRSN